MADFNDDVAEEIARAHTAWCKTGSLDARNQLFTMLDGWVRKQARHTLARWQGPRPVNTGTLAHDVLLKLLTSLNRIEYRGLRPLLSYILAAMRSYLLDLPTSRQRRKEVAVADVTPDGELAAASAVNLVYDPESNNVTIVGGDFAQMIVLLRVVERIEQLHALHGLVLQLKLLAGFTVPEIAKHLDIQPDEADEILRRARTKFRHEWNKATKTGTEDGH